MKRIRHLLEYAGFRAALAFIDSLSIGAAEKVAVVLGAAWYIFAPGRRRIAVSNILKSGITADPAEARRIARASFRHFAALAVETLKAAEVFNEDNWRERVTLDIPAETLALLTAPGRGILLISGHFGNWEVAGQLLSYLKPVTGITRDMNNPYTNRLIKERKTQVRFTHTPKHDASMGRLLGVLKRGEILALLIDQHARSQGLRIPFFGHPASTHRSPALLHLITGAPLCFGYCLRTGPMAFTLRALPPLVVKPTGNREKDVQLILETLTRQLETIIRQNPEQYLWAHRRWKASGLPTPDSRDDDGSDD